MQRLNSSSASSPPSSPSGSTSLKPYLYSRSPNNRHRSSHTNTETGLFRQIISFLNPRNRSQIVLVICFCLALIVFLSSFFPDPSAYLLQEKDQWDLWRSNGPRYPVKLIIPPSRIPIKPSPPLTRVLANSQGLTAFERVYLRNGIWYIVNDNKTGEVPPLHHIQVGYVPAPNQLNLKPEQIAQHIQLISPADAAHILGPSSGRVDGTTWVWKENFFLAHFGHMAQELLFGSWKISSLAWPRMTPSPDRLMFTLFNQPEWRDKPGLNAYVLRAAFPSLSFLYRQDFEEFKNSSLTLSFDRLVFVDRQAAKLAPLNAAANKMVAQLGSIPSASPQWWEPVRLAVVGAIEASLPEPILDVANWKAPRPMITYVSRQEAIQRRLRQEDHEELVKELEALKTRKNVDIGIVIWEKLSAAEQIRVASRTTIFLSLHGNGLSHQLWAPVTPDLSTTIEMLYPGGWARDFELVASMLGRRHYAFWDDELLWGSKMAPGMVMPEGFHAHSTPIKPAAVIQVLEAILDRREVPAHRSHL